MSIEERIRQRLQDLGFDDVRFVAAGRVPPEHEARFRDWIASGKQADMHWIDRTEEKRVDPRKVIEGAKTIVLLGTNYLPSDSRAAGQQRWAKYALYEDYHDTIEKGLIAAGKVIEEVAGCGPEDYRYYVDTGPVMERGWAALSGLAWQGKNGMAISRDHGNWLFLSCILTRLDLTPDEAAENRAAVSGSRPRRDSNGRGENAPETRPGDPVEPAPGVGLFCGSCTRCVDACPTRAIVRPGIVDSRLCLSYHTIENKGEIPEEIRPAMGGRIFGCDICLDVCPWNRFARAGRSSLLSGRAALADLGLVEILDMDPERFSQVFRKTPIKRLKLRGLLRNACVVAGNLFAGNSDPALEEWRRGLDFARMREALEALAENGEPLVRSHAVWALSQRRV